MEAWWSVTCSDVPCLGGTETWAGADQHRGNGGLLQADPQGEGEAVRARA